MKKINLFTPAISLFVMFQSCSSGSEPEKGKVFDPENEAVGAYTAAKNYIKRNLMSPSTANFPWPDTHRDVIYEGDSTFIVNSYVDSQNKFGATIRTKWHVELKMNTSTDYTILTAKTD